MGIKRKKGSIQTGKKPILINHLKKIINVIDDQKIEKIKNQNPLEINCDDFSKLSFKDYYYNHKEFMNILDYEETLNKI